MDAKQPNNVLAEQVFETVWPDKSFAQFGGHVLERLFDTHREIATLGRRRFQVRVTIEVEPIQEEATTDA